MDYRNHQRHLADGGQGFEPIESRVLSAVGCRLRELHIHRRGDRCVLDGRADSYYAKQLALHEVRSLLKEPVAANEIRVTAGG